MRQKKNGAKKLSLESFGAKKLEYCLKKFLKISAIRIFGRLGSTAVQDSGPGSSGPAGAAKGCQGDEKRADAQAAGGDVGRGAAQVARQPATASGAQQQKGNYDVIKALVGPIW